MIRAQVIVRPRTSIFDPQGDAVGRAIQHLGVGALKQAHVGKFIELEIEGDDAEALRPQLETICKDLLSNPVIEDYTLILNGENGTKSAAPDKGASVDDVISASAAKLVKTAKAKKGKV